MKIKTILTLLLFMPAFLAAPAFAGAHATAAAAEAEGILSAKEIAAARELVETKRDMTVIANLDLTPIESEKFWPLYDEYRQKIRAIRGQRLNMIEAYAERYNAGTVDDEFANQAVKDFLNMQIDTGKTRKRYWRKFTRIIPATKAARFYQLENKMDAELDFVIAGGVPLVPED